MKAVLFLCSLFLMTTFVFAQKKTNNTAKVENEIRRLEELGRVKALRKDSDWDDLWADGAYLVGAFGTVTIYTKGTNLSEGGPAANSLKMSEMIVRVYGETAVVTALMEVETETADKKPFSFKLRFMNVWRKTADGWKIVAAERTPVRPMPTQEKK